MAVEKIQTGVRFKPELLEKITHVAKYNHRSLNGQMEYLAQKCVDEYEEKHGAIEVSNKE